MTDQPNVALDPPDLPETESGGPGMLSFDELGRTADRHAREVWGPTTARGTPFPITDAAGDVVAYVFPYVRDAEQFPDNDEVFAELARLRAAAQEDPAAMVRALDDYGRRFGSVYVSARESRTPVLLVRHHLHAFFTAGPEARASARERLGRQDVRLHRIRFDGPAEEAFEFVAGDDRVDVRIQQHGPGDLDPFPLPPDPTAAPVTAAKEPVLHTEAAPAPSTAPPGRETPRGAVEKKITYWELVPPVPYTWWCVPTAYDMIMGFWDHYVPGIGGFGGHGRIIAHWYEHPTWAHLANGRDAKVGDPGSTPNNVPSITDELIDPATGTWHPGMGAFESFVANTYHYKVWTGPKGKEKEVNSSNDWVWGDIIAQVDAGRPFFWSFDAHTVVGIGYRIDGAGQKYVVYLDTYGATLSQKLTELPHTKGNAFSWLVFGQDDSPDNVTLLRPRAGETVLSSTPDEVVWFVDGSKSTSLALSRSTDAGRTWSPVGAAFPATPGRGSYRWFPEAPGSRTRWRVQAFGGTTYLAGDGSIEDVAPKPQVYPGRWVKINDAVGTVVAGYDKAAGTRAIYATDLASGDVFRFAGKPEAYWNWFKVGGPGQSFALDGQGVLYGLSPGGAGVWQYTGTGTTWQQIGGAASNIYPDVQGVCAIQPGTGNVLRYQGVPHSWVKVGGPGKSFAVDGKGMLYGVSPDGSAVWRYDGLFGPPKPWTKVGGPAAQLFARGLGVYATDPQSGNVRFFHGQPGAWTEVGGPGKDFSVDAEGRLYGLSPDGSGVWRHDGSASVPWKWSPVGGAAGSICAGWREVLATNPQTKDLWIYVP